MCAELARGHRVTGVEGWSVVVPHAATWPYELLTAPDVHLPDLDGFELASRLCADGARRRIVLVSSRDGSDFGPLIERCGACGFIAKSELSGAAVSALLR